MTAEDRGDLERELLTRLATGDRKGAATEVLAAYGPEIYAFLAALHRDESDAEEVFSRFGEALWQGLQRFEGKGSFRTFAYAVARRTSVRFRRDAARRRKREEELDSAEISGVMAEVRERTAAYLRTTTRSRLATLRASLPEEDQVLLMLRVDRKLPWEELAVVLRGEDEAPLSAEDKRREGARLRKKFQILKQRLREMARREGLLDEDG
ncbi:RNA polymerase sigma factor [Polyangium jinanense]|uniref:Sigma-70 family RNA polymerase sigma factor n=1 Tax=Polyangium jinanense TaxID=2829994 RepID=A0A9X3X0C8_9BACT|nr:sigma-70 family RNA polymerase sigma factor [Polyangium jinanense]MDC3952866.1 sigma-70 family RNA polymerase sigma factor [Polyangium jinanense]MDC3980485.1 sigma-70 family RNA polymerase sigma factor [Polyangium jinanense]